MASCPYLCLLSLFDLRAESLYLMPQRLYPLAYLLGAVTSIAKLLVVVEILKGTLLTWSIANTFIAPEPMPSRPGNTPATNISANPSGTR